MKKHTVLASALVLAFAVFFPWATVQSFRGDTSTVTGIGHGGPVVLLAAVAIGAAALSGRRVLARSAAVLVLAFLLFVAHDLPGLLLDNGLGLEATLTWGMAIAVAAAGVVIWATRPPRADGMA